MVCLLLAMALLTGSVLGQAVPAGPYECTDSDPILVMLEGPHHTVELESQSFPDFPLGATGGATGDSRCQWKVSALHGAQVEVTVLEVQMAEDCLSTSYLRLVDESSDSSRPLSYPGLKARCNQESEIPPTCLTSEGQLTITSKPGLRFRLRLKAVLPLECPAKEPVDRCPKGPCCGDADCTCEYLLGSKPLDLEPTKAGTCSFTLVTSPGSQVAVNFLEMRLPAQVDSPGCESWVTLEETQGNLASLTGTQKYCGLTLPNYPLPSVLASGSNSLTVNYFLPKASLDRSHGFKVAAAAVNPLCAPVTYQHKSGESSCSETCGAADQPQYPKRDQCPFPDPPTPQRPKPTCPGLDCVEETTPAPCNTVPEKVLILNLMERDTDTVISSAEVNITSGSSFFQRRSSLMGEVTTQGVHEATRLTISVVAKGYLARQEVLDLDCVNDGCYNCEMRMTLEMDQVVVDPEDECEKAMELKLKVVNEVNSPVAGVNVSVSYIDEDSTEEKVESQVVTDQNGVVTVPISVNGDYKVTLVKEDMVDQELDVAMKNCTNTEEEIVMEKIPSPCKATLSAHVKDNMDEAIEGAKVSVFRPGQSEPLSFSPLTTDTAGAVEQEVEPGMLRLHVSAPGFYSKETQTNCTCESQREVVQLEPLPTTTEGPNCYGSESAPVLLTVRVFDLLTKDPVRGATADVQVEPVDGAKYYLVQDAVILKHAEMGSAWNTTIKTDGQYNVTVTAQGYKEARKSVYVVCDPSDCSSCSASLDLPLRQATCADSLAEGSSATCCNEDNILRVEVRDASTLATVPDAQVTVALKTAGNGRMAVSPYLQCSLEEASASCGHNTITPEECGESNCCWSTAPALGRALSVTGSDSELAGESTTEAASTTAASTTSMAGLGAGSDGTTGAPTTPATTIPTTEIASTTTAPSYGTLFATCDNEMSVFFDGVLQPEAPGLKNWKRTNEFKIPSGTRSVGIKCQNGYGDYGIIAHSAGTRHVYGVRTGGEREVDDSWRCSGKYVKGWATHDFKPTDFEAFKKPEFVGRNGMKPWGLRSNISSSASWIWAQKDSSDWFSPGVAYCRMRIQRKEITNDATPPPRISGPGRCSAKVGEKAMTTDSSGLVSTPLPGHAEYVITVTRPGFKSLEYSWTSSHKSDTTNDTAQCGLRTIELELEQKELCRPEGLALQLTIVDVITSAPLPGTTVHLILTSSALGASQVEVGGSLSTDLEGVVTPSLYANGTYRVTASLPGYLDLSHEFSLPAEVCTDGLDLALALTPTPGPQCDEKQGTGLTLSVYDIYTKVPVEGALVDITYQENTTALIAEGVRTNGKGEARVPVSKLGMYMATLSKAFITPNSPYLEATTFVNLTCCSCPANLELSLDQLRCPDPLVNVTVMDNTTGLAIPGARISLILTGSETGDSMAMQGSILTTDMEGLALLNPTINGNYSVKVEAENYQSREVPVVLACDPMDCTSCSLEVVVELPEIFCSGRTLKLTVRDSTNNTALEGALVTFVKETHYGPNSLGTFTADKNGEVHLPLVGNGHYSAALSHPGYMNMTTTLRVAVTPDQCELLEPIELVAMNPDNLKTGCVRVSLTWAKQPQDLDLYSYRVNKNQTEDQCLTYFCDGKDPCNGVDFNTDNKDGGEAGSETITYCNVEDYSNMVWVDDRSGLGASLLGSEAKLVITADSGETEEVVLRPSEGQEPDSRYWLAGCLTTTPTDFSFLPLNQFTSGSPDLEQALHCHTRTQLQSSPAATNGEVHVSVTTTKGLPLSDALIKLTSPHQTYSKITSKDGKLVLPVNEDGSYSLLAQLDGHVPERINFSLSCEGLEGQCATSVQVTMMTLQEDGALRIKLNWPGDAGRDLDLHLVEVLENDPQTVCHTYWSNRAGCKNTELDQNMGTNSLLALADTSSSMGETITVHNLAANPSLRYLVYVDDNTATGADLSQVQPQLTMSQGNTFVTDQMPKLPSRQRGARFWLAGAVEVMGPKFRYVAAKSWSQETPSNPGLVIEDLLTRTTETTTPAFCVGSKLAVRVKDALTNQAASAVTVTVLRLEDGQEEVIAETTAPDVNGELSLPISTGGRYEVQVEGTGFVSTRKSTTISCDSSDCSLCNPSILVPLSPSLAKDQLRLTLGGDNHLADLDIHAVFRDAATTCITSPEDGARLCPGVEGVTGAGGKGVETITFARPSADTQLVYTLYVTWTSPDSAPEQSFASTNALLSLSDGSVTEEVQMEAKAYSGEKHWLAACLLLNGSSESAFNLRPLNSFFTKRPDEEVPELCLETFGLAHKAPKWVGQCVKDKRSRVLPVNFGKSSENSPAYCMKKCKSQEYAYAGMEYGKQCFCSNTPPPQEAVIKTSSCSTKCPADSASKCGGSWKLNVYETGYTGGLAMVAGRSCDCSYSPGGCSVSRAPPAGFACVCRYQGYMSCGATLRQCKAGENCPGDCKTKACCKTGGGDCGGYW